MEKLSDEQKNQLAQWIADGDGLADVQRRLGEEFGINMTYMETRFLVDDLGLQLQDSEKSEQETDLGRKMAAAQAEPPQEGAGGPPAGGGKVSVSLDQVTQPQALVSGKVTFSDGNQASWMLDQMGRLALDPDTPGYRPSEDDVMAFQQELQRVATSHGM